jgi:hypothetical protein
MKKRIYTLFASVLLISSIALLSGCGDPEPQPSNVIEDSDGIKADLDWTTSGSVNDALNEADLDLIIYKNGTKVLSSENGSSFERIQFDSNLYADGDYTVNVLLYSADKNVSYTLTINGIKTVKPYTFTSTFAETEENRSVEVLKINKSGSKFTITTVN